MNYEDIAPYLSPETQVYVPFFIAANYVMYYYREHNIIKAAPPYTYYATDTLRVKSGVNFMDMSGYISMPLAELRFLNPAVKYDTVPLLFRDFR